MFVLPGFVFSHKGFPLLRLAITFTNIAKYAVAALEANARSA